MKLSPPPRQPVEIKQVTHAKNPLNLYADIEISYKKSLKRLLVYMKRITFATTIGALGMICFFTETRMVLK